MKLDYFSPARGHMALKMHGSGHVTVAPNSPEHQACAELVAFGRAFQLPGTALTFGLERRIDPKRSVTR